MALQQSDYLRLEPLLQKAGTVAVLTHVEPDGDGVGSGIALARFLRQRGLDARLVSSQPLPLSLQFLADGEPVIVHDGRSQFLREADLIFTVDNASVSRLGPLEDEVRRSAATRVCIDHHLGHEDFWQVNLIDDTACATGEMIHRCIEALGGCIDLPMARALYVAIVTDTGRFRFPKTSAEVHRMVAGLLDLGVQPFRIHEQLDERNSRASVLLLAEALRRLQFTAGGRLAWVEISGEVLAACGAQAEDSSDVINHMLAIEGVEIGVLLREAPDGRTKISWRSKPQHDVHALAQSRGGGGHRNAAGAVVNEPLERCSRSTVAAAEALLR